MSFDKAIAFALKWEGGYSNHPNDRGGATMKGITQRNYDEWRRTNGLAQQSIRLITESEILTIYKNNYWKTSSCSDWPEPLDIVVFDIAVNSGPRAAVRWLQQIVGTAGDGIVGPATKQKVNDYISERGVKDLARSLCDRREDFYRQLCDIDPKQNVFLEGWMNRLNDLRKVVGV